MDTHRLDLSHYTEEHRKELELQFAGHDWQNVLRTGLVEEARCDQLSPPSTRPFIDTVVDQLLGLNREEVSKRIAEGTRDRDELLTLLGTWPTEWRGPKPKLSFVGINLTADCNFSPKCRYCNQPWVPATVGLDGWKRLIEEVTDGTGEPGPYVYLTGGEPMLLGEDLWGDDGLIRFAVERGAGLNVNTNAALLTPEIALRLIKSGLGKLHISLDTPDPHLGNYLFGGVHLRSDRFESVLRGIYNVQLARDLVGAGHPVIHTNCVLTQENLDTFPTLFEFILEKHKQTVDRSDPFYNDLFPHIIPVGGESNVHRRPDAEGFHRFYTEIWEKVCQTWDDYQARHGVPEDKRGVLFGYFSNPSRRVEHEGGLEAYIDISTQGQYGKLALSRSCYVWPTQIAVTPDGNYHRCGAHAIRRCLPLGNASEQDVFPSILAGIGAESLPQEEHCSGCALATLYINQAVEKRLMQEIEGILDGG